MRFLPKSPRRSWEKSAFGAFGREILRPKRLPRISSRVSGRLGGRGRAMGGSARADPPRGRAREALRKSFPRHCKNRFLSHCKNHFLSHCKNHFLSFSPHCGNRFPLSRDARGKTVSEKPARGLPHDNGPRRVGCAFCATRSQMSRNGRKRAWLFARNARENPGKPEETPRKSPDNRRETGRNAQEWAETGGGGGGEKKGGGRGKKRTPRE